MLWVLCLILLFALRASIVEKLYRYEFDRINCMFHMHEPELANVALDYWGHTQGEIIKVVLLDILDVRKWTYRDFFIKGK